MSEKKLKKYKVVIDINNASEDELMTLRGIGPVLAKRIIERRENYYIRSLAELREIPGFKENIFKMNRLRFECNNPFRTSYWIYFIHVIYCATALLSLSLNIPKFLSRHRDFSSKHDIILFLAQLSFNASLVYIIVYSIISILIFKKLQVLSFTNVSYKYYDSKLKLLIKTIGNLILGNLFLSSFVFLSLIVLYVKYSKNLFLSLINNKNDLQIAVGSLLNIILSFTLLVKLKKSNRKLLIYAFFIISILISILFIVIGNKPIIYQLLAIINLSILFFLVFKVIQGQIPFDSMFHHNKRTLNILKWLLSIICAYFVEKIITFITR